MSQAPIVVNDAAGAVVRGAINAALEALATCQSGATAPATTYPNMFWYDTANNQLKRRNNANDAWIIMTDGVLDTDGTLASNSDTKIASQKAVKTYADTKIASTVLDTDTALAANSDAKVASQKAAKAYSDTKLSKTTAGEITAMTEKTTLADDDVFIIEDSAAGNVKKKVKKSNIAASLSYSAGTVSVHANATERNNNATTATKMKESIVRYGGTLTIKMSLKCVCDGNPVRWSKFRIYRNGVAVGTERQIDTADGGGWNSSYLAAFTQISEDIAGWNPGDLLQIYGWGYDSSTQNYAKDLNVFAAFSHEWTSVT